jgi:hypothetical protein
MNYEFLILDIGIDIMNQMVIIVTKALPKLIVFLMKLNHIEFTF